MKDTNSAGLLGPSRTEREGKSGACVRPVFVRQGDCRGKHNFQLRIQSDGALIRVDDVGRQRRRARPLLSPSRHRRRRRRCLRLISHLSLLRLFLQSQKGTSIKYVRVRAEGGEEGG